MKTRFGASYISYVIAVLWPFTHLAAIGVGYVFVNRFAPIGSDPIVFVVTAALPYMLCLYPSRLIAVGVEASKPFLNYNSVTVHHIILARVILELFNVSFVVILTLAVCFILDAEIVPQHLDQAAAALGSAVFLGVAFGVLFAVCVGVFGVFFAVFVTIFMIVLYISSLPLVPDYLISPGVREYLSYNPVFILISWLRSAYYPSYELEDVNVSYLLGLSATLLFLGLLGERSVRGRIVSR